MSIYYAATWVMRFHENDVDTFPIRSRFLRPQVLFVTRVEGSPIALPLKPMILSSFHNVFPMHHNLSYVNHSDIATILPPRSVLLTAMTKFRRIGAGFCGTVWTPPFDGSPYFGYAFKREDGGPGRSLLNDSVMHQRVLSAFESMPVQIHIPRFEEFITPDDAWWKYNLDSFPSGYSPCSTIMSERIPSISESARDLLIDTYCSAELAAEIKCSEANQDSLVRPYLGRNIFHTRPSRFKAFSLRNYPLHLDQMQELRLSRNLQFYAQIMAESLAVMHWGAGIDANDVEFVLAPPGSSEQKHPVISNCLGEYVM